ncbi:tRNA uridine-5-carboxymethylaminomethyl(34) synthesis GTPase MnmE [Rhodoblastus sphagnicola]|uniref:tRNA modification GTPase MnmE n=1 Tax=Rhodoblastus sphagnicola TaxID=333368 RepID=A0A2S6N170_9HYPH|nr:tRNA uridine-5-carboxymethylaminomethyl(34) synthesis GTPase MnmE [Rhodoblastus sphagnicola]MBB4200365.1 tRNA modification GTPase [Rhodoblastus sphagnicola]PPQ28362.1 tRNA uridine-5-carboxymethylaminomethyl(34) synthesis GTPase MnmE [Rhodoblastus sphagnicola]
MNGGVEEEELRGSPYPDLEDSMKFEQEPETIFALATAHGRAALAVVRLSGSQTSKIVNAIAGKLPRPRTASLVQLRDPASNSIIDHALVTWFPGPASFTGEDCAEFSVHGSRAIVAKLVQVLGKFSGARISQPGEFSRRALENGKMSLIEVESLGDLISAETEQQRILGINGLSGKFQRILDEWRTQIIDVIAHVESSLDFSDQEDIQIYDESFVIKSSQNIVNSISNIISNKIRGSILRSGVTVLLSGPPNSGKSTLLNELSCQDIAIVSEVPGTTRDLIEVRLDMNGYLVNIIDSAGIRKSDDLIESIGINRAIERAQTADLILWLCDHRNIVSPAAHLGSSSVWRIYTKYDIKAQEPLLNDNLKISDADHDDGGLCISALSGYNLDELVRRLSEFVASNVVGETSDVIVNERQMAALERARNSLSQISVGMFPEVVATALREAMFELEILIGKIGVEDILGEIFSRFCIGK